jgi:hypothetical protein
VSGGRGETLHFPANSIAAKLRAALLTVVSLDTNSPGDRSTLRP